MAKSAKQPNSPTTKTTKPAGPKEMKLCAHLLNINSDRFYTSGEFDTLMIDESRQLYLCNREDFNDDTPYSPEIWHRVDLTTALRWYVSITRHEYEGSGDALDLCELALDALGSPVRTIKQELARA